MPSPTAFATLVDPSTSLVAPAVGQLSDSDLLGWQRSLAEIRRRVDSWSAAVAGEIAHRSRPELGHDGLAQRAGARTPELLVQQQTGTSAREAHTMVRIGLLAADPSSLDAVSAAVAAGTMTLDAADAIRSGLTQVDGTVPAGRIADAAVALVADAGSLTVEKLAARARECAAELDDAHVADRARAMRDARYLRITPQSDGMTRLSGLLDPESAAVVVAVFDGVTSPRRGGPRFVDPGAIERAERLTRDPRSTEQVAVDAFVDLIRLGSDAAPEIVGTQRPPVRVIVTESDLRRRAGSGCLDGQAAPLSIPAVEREMCANGYTPIVFTAEGQPVDVGRTQRTFTSRQRTALAVRDGGCRFPGCARPPSWCEAHHITPWSRGGPTDLLNGILMCRHHHLLVHDAGWEIRRSGGEYQFVPPRSSDLERHPIDASVHTHLVERALGAA